MHQFHDGDYTRTTITVPRTLKRRMKLQGQGINWSAIACAAFRAKLDGIKQERKAAEVKTKEQAIERLRQLKQNAKSDACGATLGHEAGQAWAKTNAHPDQLLRLTEFVQSPEFEEAQRRGRRLVRRVTAAILGLKPEGRRADGGPPSRIRQHVIQLWENEVCAPELPPPPEFVRDFALGAVAFWLDIRDEL